MASSASKDADSVPPKASASTNTSSVTTGLSSDGSSSTSDIQSSESKKTSGTSLGGTSSNVGSSESETGESSDTGECHEGAKSSCSELEDGSPVEFPSGEALGNCQRGFKTCVAGRWGKCIGTIAPASKDECDKPGDDSDCDGAPNSGCACIDGQTRPCGHNDIGECKLGVQACVGGKWSDQCTGAVMPRSEICDGENRDEDCNGSADLADSSCDCIDGDSEYCERGAQKGDCKWGKKSCVAGKWSGCSEWARPVDEVCGSRASVSGVEWTGDEDCDGRIDTSPLGKRGPDGCVDMMFDQDNDGYGRIGKDLSQMAEGEDLKNLATACLCLSRPDIQEKYREGWVRSVNGRANTDCGDCKDLDGEVVFPGSRSTTRTENRCLKSLRWTLSGAGGPGYFDLNCDGMHRDPSGPEIGALRCKTYKDPNKCEDVGPGRLVVTSPKGIECGRTYEYGFCETQYDLVPKLDEDGNEVGTEVVFTGCKPSPEEGGPGSHTVECQ